MLEYKCPLHVFEKNYRKFLRMKKEVKVVPESFLGFKVAAKRRRKGIISEWRFSWQLIELIVIL